MSCFFFAITHPVCLLYTGPPSTSTDVLLEPALSSVLLLSLSASHTANPSLSSLESMASTVALTMAAPLVSSTPSSATHSSEAGGKDRKGGEY